MYKLIDCKSMQAMDWGGRVIRYRISGTEHKVLLSHFQPPNYVPSNLN